MLYAYKIICLLSLSSLIKFQGISHIGLCVEAAWRLSQIWQWLLLPSQRLPCVPTVVKLGWQKQEIQSALAACMKNAPQQVLVRWSSYM